MQASEHMVSQEVPTLSVRGAIWEPYSVDSRAFYPLLHTHGLSELFARILVARGVTLDDVPHFLEPTLRHGLPDPLHLKDMERAAERIARAIQQGESIVVLGDYDVDGATSSALLKRFFRMVNHQAHTVFIPDRMVDGYGPSVRLMDRFAKEGHHVVITVDCGTLAFEALAHAKTLGLDVIVLDHHQSDVSLPDAYALVNPNRVDETSPIGHVAAVGVAFLFVIAVRKMLENQGYFSDTPPSLLELLDLVALGTVCDVVPLTSVNRVFVRQGLKIFAARQNLGLTTLAESAGIHDRLTTYHLGYLLGPRINAGGRVGESYLGTQLLSTQSAEEAASIAAQLEHYNEERKAIEAQVLDEAMAMAEVQAKTASILLLEGEGWHPGVIGIVAGRVKERFHLPAAVIAWDSETGLGKASARSIAGFDIGQAVILAKQAELLVAGGGHKMAAGFTVTRDAFPLFAAHMQQQLLHQLGGVLPARTFHFDGYLAPEGVTTELALQLEALEPFGSGMAEPCFVVSGVQPIKIMAVGAMALRIVFAHAGVKAGSYSFQAMAFGMRDTPTEALLQQALCREPVDILVKLRVNRWQGRESVTVFLEDVRVCA